MNGHANCILAVCCPPRSPQQKIALYEDMSKALGETPSLKEVCHWVSENLDLAPAGSLEAFKAEIARLARENP